jgi:putative flippase GtrA
MSMIPGSQPDPSFGLPTPAEPRRALGNRLIGEVGRFGVVGLANTAVDLVVLNALILLTHMGRNGIWFSIFKAISFLVAVLNSYFINHSWTFARSGGERSVSQAGQFLAVSLLGAVINVSSASYVATFISPIHGFERYWPSIAALAGTASALIFNFLGYKHIVFSPRRLFPSADHRLAPSARAQEPPTSMPADPNADERGEGSRVHNASRHRSKLGSPQDW